MLMTRLASWARAVDDARLRDQLRGRIHAVAAEGCGVVFSKRPVALFECAPATAACLADFLRGEPRDGACARHDCRREQLDELLGVVRDRLSTVPPPEPDQSGEPVLDRLVINVSNDCNLRCAYCYAAGGSYGGRRAAMDTATALATIEAFTSTFSRINKVQFFGGEPLLNADLIGFVCQEFHTRFEDRRIAALPAFGIVTNGTIASPEVVALLQRFDISVTVSIDGPEPVHDALRGQGTFRKVRRFTGRLRRNGIDFGVEGTFTALHLRSGVTLADLLRFYREELGCATAHVPAVQLPPGHPLAIDDATTATAYRQAIAASMDGRDDDESASLAFASRLLEHFSEGRPTRPYCAAGSSTLSVDVAGRIYPCFMFTGMQDFCLGSVFADAPPAGGSARRIGELMALVTKDSEVCRSCWAEPLCFGCAGGDYVRSGGRLERTGCEVMKAMAEEFLLRAASTRTANATRGSQQSGKEVGYARKLSKLTMSTSTIDLNQGG